MTEELKRFYRELQEWLDDGRPEHPTFDADYGLCSNAYDYGEYFLDDGCAIADEQTDLFYDAGLDGEYPFNDLHDNYMKESRNKTLMDNPRRLAWIKEHAQ